MTRYFMQDTPLRHLERMMMTPPNFIPRGHGIRRSSFRYKPKDVECRYCESYDRKNPCPLDQCICLEERIEAGALDLTEFVRDRFGAAWTAQLQERLEEYLSRKDAGFFSARRPQGTLELLPGPALPDEQGRPIPSHGI